MGQYKTLFVLHEITTTVVANKGKPYDLDKGFYENSKWGARPNSTVRLSAVNLKAMESLAEDLDITIRTDIEWSEELAQLYSDFDVIILNSVASKPSIQFNIDLINWKKSLAGKGPKLVLGTEITWEACLKREEISEEDYRNVYFDNLLLRHTARTDRKIYATPDCHESSIQEFEIGIDFSVLPAPKPIEDRKLITFVRAPEGRITKNNPGIDELISRLEADERLKGYEIREIAPPYSVVDYWNILSESAFLLFTSMGETFSYAMNDAKALGVITLLTEQMYFTTIGRRYSVDAYPSIGLRYKDYEEAVETVAKIAGDSILLKECSQQSFESAQALFSLEKVKQNFRALLTDQSLNTQGLYIYGESHENWEEILEIAKLNNCRYVMPYRNMGPGPDTEQLALYDPVTDTTFLKYYLTVNNEKLRRIAEIVEGKVVITTNGPEARELGAEMGSYLQLVARSYKIGRVLIDGDLSNSGLFENASKVKVFGDLRRGMVPVDVWAKYNARDK